MRKIKVHAIIPKTGGLNAEGFPHPWTIKVLEKTLELWSGREWILIPGRGTVYRPPPLDRGGFPIDECMASAQYLVERGVRSSAILTERVSLDTIGNAYFTRVLFAEPMHLQKMLILAPRHTMPRTKAIFEWVYGLPPLAFRYDLSFLSVSDEGLNESLVKLRLGKEKKSLRKLGVVRKKVTNMRQLQEWLFTEHGAYAYGKKPEKLRGGILKTY